MMDGRRAFVVLLVGVALGALGFGLALAQDEPEVRGQEECASDDEECMQRHGFQLESARRANLTDAQRIAEAGTILENAGGAAATVQSQLADARRSNDTIRVNCLNDKLNRINAHRETLETRVGRLRDHASGDLFRHEFTVITVLNQQIEQLQQEAAQCLGDDVYNSGVTRVVTIIDEGTPEEALIITDWYLPAWGIPPCDTPCPGRI